MPDGPEIKVNVNTGSGPGQINDLTSSVNKLASGVEVAEANFETMRSQLEGMASTIGVSKNIINEFLVGLIDRSQKGIVTIRDLNEEYLKLRNAEGGKSWSDSEEESLRALRKAIDLYKELNAQVRSFNEAANVAAASGKLANLPQFEARAENIYSRYPLTPEHVQSMTTSIGNVSGANQEMEVQRQLAQLEKERAQQEQEETRQLAQLERDRAQQRAQEEREYTQMERERAQLEQQALRENAQMQREVAQNRAREIQAQTQEIEQQLRLERELIALEDRAALAGKRGTARIDVMRSQALRGETDPNRISRIGGAFDTMAEAEEGGGGLSARMMRGVAQGAMGVGAGNYQMYYLMNSISNIGAGGAVGAGVAAAGVSIAALAAAQIAAADAAAQHARELRNMSVELGTTAHNARELENVAKVTGVPMDTVVSGMRQLTQGIEESGGRGRGASSVLSGMGINPLTDTGGVKDMKDILMSISDVLRTMPDLEGRDVLERLFGRGGRQLLPMLKQDVRGLSNELSGLNSSLDNDKLNDYAASVAKLSLAWEGLVASFAKPIIVLNELGGSNGILGGLATMVNVATIGLGGGGLIPSFGVGSRIGGGTFQPTPIGGAVDNRPQWLRDVQDPIQAAEAAHHAQLVSGAAARQTAIHGLEHGTPEGVAKLVQDAQKKYDDAVTALRRPDEAVGTTIDQLKANVKSSGSELEQARAEQKALTEGPRLQKELQSERLRLQKELNAEQEKELFGHEKIHKALLDELAAEKQKLNTKTLPPDIEASIHSRYNAEDTNYDARLSAVQNRSDVAAARSSFTAHIGLNRAGATAQMAVNRAARMGAGGYEDINNDYTEAMGNAYSSYAQSISEVNGRQVNLIQERDPEKRISMQAGITESRQDAQRKFASESVEALKQSLVSTLGVTKQLTEEQRKYNSALDELKTRGSESATTLREGLIKRSLSDSMQITRARARGGSAGVLANNEFSYSMQMSGLGISDALSGARESRNDENKRSSDVMASALTPQDRTAEDIKHAQEVFAIKQKLQAELGQQMETIDEAHIQLQKSSIEIQQQQNEQVKAFAGDLLGAYMQAMLHRQSGSFPVREALGQQFLGWGKKIGENVAGAGFGILQGSGVGQHDIIPGLARTTVDPKTGQPKEELTALGKIFQGTPLAHRAAGNDRYVMSIDDTTKAIYTLMQTVFGQQGSGPYFPGQTTDVAGDAGSAALPIGWNSPLGSGSETGAIINSLVGGGKGSTASSSSLSSSSLGGLFKGIGGLFGTGSGSGAGSPSDLANFDSQGNFISTGGWPGGNYTGGISPGLNLPLASGAESGSIINSLAGMSNHSTNDANTSGVTETVDAAGNPQFNTNVIGSSASPATKSGTFSSINTGTTGSTISSAANDAVAGLKDVNAVIGAYNQFKQNATKKTGAGLVAADVSSSMQAAATVANSIPGGQVVGGALEIGAMVAAGVSAIFGDPRATRLLQEQYDAQQHQWTAPSAYNLVTSQNGMSVTSDIKGGQREYNGPLLAFPNTSSYTSAYDYTVNRVGPQIAPPSGTAWPGGGSMSMPNGLQPLGSTILSIQINALDSKSILDNSDVIASAVHIAINGGHPIRNGIQAAANPR